MAAEAGKQVQRGYKTDSYITAIQGNYVPTTVPKEEAVQKEELIPEIPQDMESAPLTTEDLENYKNDPKWNCIRRLLCFIFCIIWLILFLLALYLIISAPGCAAVVSKWWQGGVIYQLWTPSFQDSDGDGIGDFDGVNNRLSDLRKIGVTALFPRPFISTEKSGQGVLDYKSVDESLGGLPQAKKLIDEVHSQGLKIIIDIPVVATSDRHEWFQRSSKASLPENSQFASYYYWKRNVEPSSNVNYYKNSSVLYFHIKDRPDLPILNWKNQNVSNSVKEAISFWIDLGVDGFHLGFVEHLARTPDAQNADWDEIVQILKGIRDHIDSYVNESAIAKGKDIFLIASPEPIKEEQKRLLQQEAGLDAVVNTELLRIAKANKICYESEYNVAGCSNEILSDLLVFHAYDGVYPVWELGNAFTSRLATRVKSRIHAELLTMIQMLLPGTSMVYYGEDIGLKDSESSSFPQRGGMQWDDSTNAGFSTSPNPKAQIQPDYVNVNFNQQFQDDQSPLRVFKTLARLRKDNKVLINGQTYISKVFNNAFSFCRFEQKDNATCGKVYVAVVNFGKQEIVHSLADLPPLSRAGNKGEIIAVNSNARNWKPRQVIDLSSKSIKLGPEEGVVFYFKA